MTITARTDNGRVWIDGFISHTFMRDGVFAPIKFLVDTGASNTTILPGAASELKVDFEPLAKHPSGMVGIGGHQDAYVMENASLLFPSGTSDTPIVLRSDVCVLKPEQETKRRFPFAVFGTDLLRNFRFEYDMPKATLDLKNHERLR